MPRILSDASASLPRAVCGSIVADAWLTSTDVAIVVLAGADGRSSAIIKLPVTAAAGRGLGRESAALVALQSDSRLGDWRARLARPLASGVVFGQHYRIDSALPGRSIAAADAGPARVEGAIDTIHVLHRMTATPVVGDSWRWVDAPLQELARHGRSRAPVLAQMQRLRDELHAAVAGRTFRAGWVHGDYWLGNLLFADATGRPQGIVDWEAAGAPELPLHDVLHLLVSTRRLRGGEQLGAIVLEHMTGERWPPRERRLLDCYASSCHDGLLSDRQALLLYWLRQVGTHARQQSRLGGIRYQWWERRNVHAVLAAL